MIRCLMSDLCPSVPDAAALSTHIPTGASLPARGRPDRVTVPIPPAGVGDSIGSAGLRGFRKLDVYRPGPLLGSLDLEGDPLPLMQRFKGGSFNPRAMEENLSAVVR